MYIQTPGAMIVYAPAQNPVHVITIDDKPLHAVLQLIDDGYNIGTESKQFQNPLYDHHDAEMTTAADYVQEPGVEMHVITYSLKLFCCQTTFTPCFFLTTKCRKN